MRKWTRLGSRWVLKIYTLWHGTRGARKIEWRPFWILSANDANCIRSLIWTPKYLYVSTMESALMSSFCSFRYGSGFTIHCFFRVMLYCNYYCDILLIVINIIIVIIIIRKRRWIINLFTKIMLTANWIAEWINGEMCTLFKYCYFNLKISSEI